MLVTVPAATAVNVRAFNNTANNVPPACPNAANGETSIVTDVNGGSTISAVRIN